MAEQFLQSVLNFNWAPIIYGGFVLFALWFIVKRLEFSLTDLFSTIMKELRPTKVIPWTRSSLNGMGLILVGVVVVLYFFFDRVKQMIEFLHNVQGHRINSNPYEFAATVFFLCLFALLSSRSIPPEKP